MSSKTQNVVFFHPDLGIGGAERLVIDAAVGLQDLGHNVTIFTSHCDPSHCFEEARDGTLDVRVRGNSLIPSKLFGRFSILCAILRQLHLILQISLFSSELRTLKPDSFFVDQLSAGIPLLRILQSKVRIIFYCHFPDKLLAKRGNLLKLLYRAPFDWLESWSTGCSDTIVVNSKFTKGIFARAFPVLKGRDIGVVYPTVDTSAAATRQGSPPIESDKPLWNDKKVLLSINRFEEKKNVALAIRAYADLNGRERGNARLVIAGGYDPRNQENHRTHSALEILASSLSLKTATAKSVITALSVPSDVDVLFLHSVPNAFKTTLLSQARLLVYTPLHEHFGIVPLEAMLAETPVLAADEGGPTETVVDGETGWLRDVKRVNDWTTVMRTALSNEAVDVQKLGEMGRRGKARVRAEFSKSKMAERLDNEIIKVATKPRPRIVDPIVRQILGFLVSLTFTWYIMRRSRTKELS